MPTIAGMARSHRPGVAKGEGEPGRLAAGVHLVDDHLAGKGRADDEVAVAGFGHAGPECAGG